MGGCNAKDQKTTYEPNTSVVRKVVNPNKVTNLDKTFLEYICTNKKLPEDKKDLNISDINTNEFESVHKIFVISILDLDKTNDSDGKSNEINYNTNNKLINDYFLYLKKNSKVPEMLISQNDIQKQFYELHNFVVANYLNDFIKKSKNKSIEETKEENENKQLNKKELVNKLNTSLNVELKDDIKSVINKLIPVINLYIPYLVKTTLKKDPWENIWNKDSKTKNKLFNTFYKISIGPLTGLGDFIIDSLSECSVKLQTDKGFNGTFGIICLTPGKIAAKMSVIGGVTVFGKELDLKAKGDIKCSQIKLEIVLKIKGEMKVNPPSIQLTNAEISKFAFDIKRIKIDLKLPGFLDDILEHIINHSNKFMREEIFPEISEILTKELNKLTGDKLPFPKNEENELKN